MILDPGRHGIHCNKSVSSTCSRSFKKVKLPSKVVLKLYSFDQNADSVYSLSTLSTLSLSPCGEVLIYYIFS